ncbi:hypothetical protein OPU71_10235 [Niveibacterium sp. 24ML]|uniref:hypothetical protein n=1 Tax=Niveibacterium sp. 24ML TaxID=2985512 RepID=UPI00226EF4DE|nr:hypothetical protein [Niveibacterium sp. 24ML]MCX9156499.1 hypothetical protein [Niveibacterium sp. 24ML]
MSNKLPDLRVLLDMSEVEKLELQAAAIAAARAQRGDVRQGFVRSTLLQLATSMRHEIFECACDRDLEAAVDVGDQLFEEFFSVRELLAARPCVEARERGADEVWGPKRLIADPVVVSSRHSTSELSFLRWRSAAGRVIDKDRGVTITSLVREGLLIVDALEMSAVAGNRRYANQVRRDLYFQDLEFAGLYKLSTKKDMPRFDVVGTVRDETRAKKASDL